MVLKKTGTGTLTLTGTNTYIGGTLQAGASNAAFFLNLDTANVQTGGALIDTQGYNVTVMQNLLHDTTSGAAATDGGLTKLGTGTLTFPFNSTYTGPTNVNAGTLLAANSGGSATGSGAVTVNSGGTLGGGGGTIAGAVTVQSGGTLAPGAMAISRLTLSSTLTLRSGATLAITLGGTTAGSGYDQVRVGGQLTLAGSPSVRTVNNFTLTPGMTFTILDDVSTAPTSGLFGNAAGALYTDARGDTFRVNYTASADGDAVPNDVTLTVLTVAVVPEPSAWALSLVAVGGLLLAARRRERRMTA